MAHAFNIRVTPEMAARVETFRKASGLPNTAAAVRAIIEVGLGKQPEMEKIWRKVVYSEIRRELVRNVLKQGSSQLNEALGDLLDGR